MLDRRTFLRKSSQAAALSLLLPYYSCSGEGKAQGSEEAVTDAPPPTVAGKSIDQYGIQLWTLRDIISEDPKGILRALSEFGYKQIESYEGDQGIFWGMQPQEYKGYLESLGMQAIGSHCDISKNFEAKAQQAGEIGMQYLVCPWVGPKESMDDFKRIADQFNECGAICKKYGLRFAYHNHDYSFVPLEDQIPHDYLMENTDPETVDFEMDIYWVVTAGVDPVEYLKRYPNRFRLSHVKDRMKSAAAEEKQASCVLGTGSIDMPKILDVAEEQGMQYFIVEQERYDQCEPLQCAEKDAAYMEAVEI